MLYYSRVPSNAAHRLPSQVLSRGTYKQRHKTRSQITGVETDSQLQRRQAPAGSTAGSSSTGIPQCHAERNVITVQQTDHTASLTMPPLAQRMLVESFKL